LANSLDGFLLPAEEIVAEGRAVVLVNLDAAGLLLVTNFRLLFLVSFICLWTMLFVGLIIPSNLDHAKLLYFVGFFWPVSFPWRQ
jgi:hypothetical protein